MTSPTSSPSSPPTAPAGSPAPRSMPMAAQSFEPPSLPGKNAIMSTDLKLYQSNTSPNSRRVRIYLAEKGICASTIPVDLGAKEQFSDAYAAINPRKVIPTLVLGDGTAIGEVPAIWRYLEEAYPDRSLLGNTPKEKALVTMWERRVELEGFNPTMEAVRHAAAGLKR